MICAMIFRRFMLLLMMAGSVCADGTEAYVSSLQALARERGLAGEPYWEVLGHYRRGLFGTESLIDDPAFFFSPVGRTDPAAELDATLAAFFEPATDNLTNHPVCRFPARFEWLKEQLSIDSAKLPVDPCPIVERVYEFMKPETLVLVFPSAYMNSPASMFGHTLLLFERPDENRLLARSVSYAARTDESIGPLFAFAGIFGLYPGYFAIEPYYDKVEQYNDINRRDIWEYRLNFTPAEVRRIFLHTWELQNTFARYFFFDENCAYMLYSLYDVARPELNLRHDKGLYVIPIDTVKKIVDKGLVEEISYRPSKVSRIKAMAGQLTPDQRRMARELAAGGMMAGDLATWIPDDENARKAVLDVAAILTQFRLADGTLGHEGYNRQFFDLLRTRSKLGPLPDDAYPVIPPRRPDEGHPSSLIALGGGWEREEPYISLRFRPAYHELLDNDIGYDRGAQILFLNTIGRWYPERDRFTLEHWDLVSVESIAPRDDLFKPYSWKVRTGITRYPRAPEDDDLVGFLHTGSGMAWENRILPGLFYGMIDARVQAGRGHPDDAAAGGGGTLGWMVSMTDTWKWLATISVSRFVAGETYTDLEGSFGTDVRLNDRWSLRAEYRHILRDGYEQPDARLTVGRYF